MTAERSPRPHRVPRCLHTLGINCVLRVVWQPQKTCCSPPMHACSCHRVMVVPADTKPIFIREDYKGSDKLKGKVAIITGGAWCWCWGSSRRFTS